MAENSIARELLDEIDIFEHTRVAHHIPRSAEISLKYFETSGLSDEYFLDLDDVFLKNKRKLLKFRMPNPDHVYEIFGKYSHENADVVRSSIVDYITCDPVSFNERMVVVLTMLRVTLDEWLLRIKNPKSPADEAVVYGLCQLYSRHALAYTTGSVWCTLEIHGKCSLQDVKRNCDIHLVFLEGGVLGHLHKKPSVPKLMSGSRKDNQTSKSEKTEPNPNPDHTYSSPVPRIQQSIAGPKKHKDHTYAEDSDVSTKPYISDQDGKSNSASTGASADGHLVIASTDNLEISVEYPKSASLLEETGTGQNASEMLLDASNAGIVQASPKNSVDQIHSVSPDETTDHEALLEATSTPNQSPDATNTTSMVDPDATRTGQVTLLDELDKHMSPPDATSEQGCDTPDVAENTLMSDTGCTSSEQLPDLPETMSVTHLAEHGNVLVPRSTSLVSTTHDKAVSITASNEETQTMKDTNEFISDNQDKTDTLGHKQKNNSVKHPIISEVSTNSELIIGEISFTDRMDATHHDTSNEISNFKPVETSSVVSELTESSHTPESICASINNTSDDITSKKPDMTNNDSNVTTTDSSLSSRTKRARLKSCIIQLTELSNQERDKWMSGSNQSASKLNSTNDTGHDSTSSSNSRYNMRIRPGTSEHTNWKTGRKKPPVNYRESGVLESGHDSDYEVKLKPLPPLGNKSYPSASRIATQHIIESNRANKQTKESTLPDESETSNFQINKGILPDVTPNTIPDESEVNAELTDETKGEEPQTITVEPVDSENRTVDEKSDKRKKGVFKTKTITIRRARDPRMFKCSVCDGRFPSLRELNAHYIQNHRNVNCDICGKAFSTPSSLRKHCYSHIDDKEQWQCRTCDKRFLFESQLKSHRHSHRRARYYKCVSANCNRSFKHPGDLAAHVRSHGITHNCAHCSYSNTDIRNLRSHMRVHSIEAPFTCKACGQKFVHSNQLVRHRPKCTRKPKTE